MKKQLLMAAAATLLAFGAQSALAQNIAIVNGKAVPKSRLDALAQQVAKSGRPISLKFNSRCATPSSPAKFLRRRLKSWA